MESTEPKRFGAAIHQSFNAMPYVVQHRPLSPLQNTRGKCMDFESFVLTTSAIVDSGAE
jgi:hypothetical protein